MDATNVINNSTSTTKKSERPPPLVRTDSSKNTEGDDRSSTESNMILTTRMSTPQPGPARPHRLSLTVQSDPNRARRMSTNDNWPREGAKLRGRLVVADGGRKSWMVATHVLQKGETEWKPAPEGVIFGMKRRESAPQ
mmetsp:Transcript_8699/g.15197  ORF Transcript_8699/g.15197 Transcript_8699/m.15197 type:complete len:138 (-) Transcript_8699:93-506(-)